MRILLVATLVCSTPIAAVADDELGAPPRMGAAITSFVLSEALWAANVGMVVLTQQEWSVPAGLIVGVGGPPLVSQLVGTATGWDGSYGLGLVGGVGGALGGFFGTMWIARETQGSVTWPVAIAGTATGSALGATIGWWAWADPSPELGARWRAEERARRAREAQRRRDRPPPKKKPRRKKREAPPPPPPSEVMPWLGAVPDADGRLVPAVGLGGRF